MVNIADCCHPVKGDQIIGYITKGNGVTIHKKNCINIKNINDRLINVNWNLDSDNTYISKLKIITNNDYNNMLDIITKASLKNVIVTSINEFNKNNTHGYNITIKVKDKNVLDSFIESIRILSYVSKVELED